jgi:DNA-binding response OmpR family regulator
MRYVFDDYTLDTQRYELWCRGQRLKLRPKVFAVLAYVIRHRDRVVSEVHPFPAGAYTFNQALIQEVA